MATAAISFQDHVLARDVDQLGDIKAQIASLKQIEAEITARIAANGAGSYEGAQYRASVSETDATYSLDAKAAEAKLRELGVDGRWFSKHQKERKGYTSVRVVARKGI